MEDMEMDPDDPMEIDDTVPTTPIIERKSDDALPPTSASVLETPINSPTEFHASETYLQDVAAPRESQKDGATNEDTEIVILDDDDDSPESNAVGDKINGTHSPTNPPVKDIIDLVEKSHNTSCLNSSCNGHSTNIIRAPDFCLSYYRIKRSKNHKEEICEDCYAKAVKDFDRLASTLKDGGLLLAENYPVINETLQIDDSDDEDTEKDDEMDYIDKEDFDFLSENIDEILEETLQKLNTEKQLQLETKFLEKEIINVEDGTSDLAKQIQEVRKKLDGFQLGLYSYFRPDFCHLKGLTIIDDYTYASNTIIKIDSEAPRKSTRCHRPVSYVELDDNMSSSPQGAQTERSTMMQPPPDLPPLMAIEKPDPKVGELYYIARENQQGNWIRARLTHVLPAIISASTPKCYKLTELKQQKERFVNGKSIAYLYPCKVRLPVGTRVISVFKETNDFGGKKFKHDLYYAGVVAEQPFEGNDYRYLIFFDIGYSQYVSYHSVNLVYEASHKVWEDVLPDSRPFIKKYLESQDRPMVKLAKDQTVRVEYNGKWWLCTVMKVDCSLVQVFFDSLSRTEWIYRGSTRLSPMFREEQAATNRHTGLRKSRKAGPNESATVVQYTRQPDYVTTVGQPPPEQQHLYTEQRTPSEQQQQQQSNTNNVRAVAKKSTARPQPSSVHEQHNIVPFLPQVNNTPSNVSGPTSKIMYFTPHDKVIIRRTYHSHECSPRCKEYLTHNFSQLRGHNPLSKPLLCGWGRMTMKAKSGNRKEIIYKAPCGRLLRNIAEVHYYLRLTESEMTVDLFDFNHMVRCLAEFAVECNPDPKDLSKGLEQVPIPVINGINNDMLDFCNYSIRRVPMEGVNLNLDPEFLCCCDCVDNCIDKTKCACWKLTMEGAKYIDKDIDPNSIGYIYRRLPEAVCTGIYECNAKCKCSSTCLNRVVQNPMSLKLQVFKTHNRGWGIRCLNDIPQGTFICIYAGTLHTEAMANKDGMAYGDEYFAELDYIETVEKIKEDYEAEVMEDGEYREKSPIEEEEDEGEELRRNNPKKRNSYSVDNDFSIHVKHGRYDTQKSGDSTIRTRLRTRHAESVEEEKPSDRHKDSDRSLEVKEEPKKDVKPIIDKLSQEIETVTISDEEDEGREVLNFDSRAKGLDEKCIKYTSVRELFGEDECVYVMDAKNAGNIGRFLNHSCSPNVFVQNVFVDTHDPRFPWVAFFSSQFIRAGTELTWNYNYDIGSVPNRVLYCLCSSLECKGRLL